tara:strand:+ start:7214 stop:7495 length:282 start_codon:yes stop_codon:yes gene_type:complete
MDNFIYNAEKQTVMISFMGHIINFDLDEIDMEAGTSYQGFELTDGSAWNMEWYFQYWEEGTEPTVVIYGAAKDADGEWERTDDYWELENKFKK